MSHNRRVLARCTATLLFTTTALVVAAATSAFAGSGWSSADVGTTGPTGSAAQADGVWTVQGGGTDIWGTQLVLARFGSTVEGRLFYQQTGTSVSVGSIDINLPSNVELGFAVTSHDPTRPNTSVYDHPGR